MIRRLIAALALCACAAHAQVTTPFLPGATANVVVSASAQALTVPTITNPGPLWQYVVTSTASPIAACTQPTFFTIDGTTATVNNGMPVLPNSAFVISVAKAITTWSVIGADVGCTFYVTVGVGQ